MKLSVIVPTWRRPEDLTRCLAGLAAQLRPADEVLVVARREDSETWAALERSSGSSHQLPVRGISVAVSGVVPSLRAGLNASRGDVVAITDDDAVPRRDWLERIERLLERDPTVGGVGGRDWVHRDGVLNGGERTVGSVRWYGRVIGNHHLGVGGPREVDLLKGANMAFRARAVRPVDLDDGLRGEGDQPHWEIDLCLSVKRNGWTLLYDPAIAVDHYPAPRFEREQRAAGSAEALRNEVHNRTYALLKGLPGWRAPITLAYEFLVGTRQAPGLAAALERRARGKRVWARLATATGARREAVGTIIRYWSQR
jgi:cellulose synthase/poly-beta-1,6-N-acetylglucosamine synthase-like glycosyltransferase